LRSFLFNKGFLESYIDAISDPSYIHLAGSITIIFFGFADRYFRSSSHQTVFTIYSTSFFTEISLLQQKFLLHEIFIGLKE
jgi:hypothetical protein